MQDLIIYILAGGSVGFVIGMTGVGGGSFMTPILLAFGFSPAVAVGTDLLYASITKAGGVIRHRRQNTIDWHIVRLMAYGSIPASLATTWLLQHWQQTGFDYSNILTTALGVMLLITASVLLFRTFLLRERHQLADEQSELGKLDKHYAGYITIVMGVLLGVFVTLSSVGAGAFAAAVLMVLYPRMPMIKVIGTDLAHAVPLTLIAGLGHLHLGHVDFVLLFSLLTGSLPGIWLGTQVANHVPEKIMQRIMATILMTLGIRYMVF